MYVFKLNFNLAKVDDEEVSRLLSDMVLAEPSDLPELIKNIQSTRLCEFNSESDLCVKQMLILLAASGENCCYYDAETKAYTLTRFPENIPLFTHSAYFSIEILDQDEKRFYCFWGEGYTPEARDDMHFDYFTDDNGYELADHKAIAELVVGQAHTIVDPVNGAYHSIIRTK